MKKALAKEFLWLVFAVVMAIPLGFLFLYFLQVSPEGRTYANEEEEFIVQLYLLGVVLSFIGIYLIRMIVGSLRAITE